MFTESSARGGFGEADFAEYGERGPGSWVTGSGWPNWVLPMGSGSEATIAADADLPRRVHFRAVAETTSLIAVPPDQRAAGADIGS